MTAAGQGFGLHQEANVFWCSSAKRRMPKGTMRFRTFPSLEDAVRFVVGDKTEARFQCAINTDAGRYEGHEIEELYNHPDFPDEEVVAQPMPLRRAGRGFLGKLPVASRYDVKRDERGTWSVLRTSTGEAVSINSVLMTRMSLPDAERMAEVLNGSDEQDMLAVGP